ncbi:phospholipid scramblase 3-like [Ascaphus truei]|uniref:phospholipid scramblase 3-like n=1 Tax=Ascaphus truei TaxID=8439 RepID=UPI003F59360B
MAHIPGVPPGLEHLLQLDQVHIKHIRQSMFQAYHTYDLLSHSGHLLFRVEQERECWGPRLDLRVRNLQGYDVLNVLLPSACCSCDTKMQVSCPPGLLLGYVEQDWGSFTSSFTLLTPEGEASLCVRGPGWGGGFMSDTNFQVTMLNSSQALGQITRIWRGLFSSNDHYSVQFPIDLDVKVKALLIACTLYINHLYYEQRNASSAGS